MGNYTLLQKESKLHRGKKKSVNYRAESAVYLRDYILMVTFFSGEVKEIDFAPALEKYGQGYYEKFKKQSEFKKFKVEDGNIFWGKNEDLIFTPASVYKNKF